MRIRAHEVDTRALQHVQLAMSDEWLPRLTTERDYGIDLLFEMFVDGDPAGAYLLLQIKGRDRVLARDQEVAISFPVKTLLLAEAWLAPVLAVICPIQNEHSEFAYLWLQEYIRVVLNYDRLGWRRQKHVTIRCPADNWMPGGEANLAWLADYPARVEALGQLARIEHELRYATDAPYLEYQLPEALERVRGLLEQARQHAAVLSRRGGAELVAQTIESGLRAVALLESGRSPSLADLRSIGHVLMTEDEPIPGMYQFVLRSHLSATANNIGAFVALGFDVGVKRGLWETQGLHRF